MRSPSSSATLLSAKRLLPPFGTHECNHTYSEEEQDPMSSHLSEETLLFFLSLLISGCFFFFFFFFFVEGTRFEPTP